MSILKYRPEIDGLRAVAVMAVIVYHAHILLGGHRILAGGFLGVDIFFVISGYLISKIIINEMTAKTFSFTTFYERRARRILPALFLVMAASTICASLVMMPQSFNEYADSLLATLFFGSNIFFWLQDSYTAVASDYKPLLHTWSLAVEEQFYLFFPPLLLIFFKRPKLSRFVFAALMLTSLVTAQYLSSEHSDSSFYLLHTRIWELLAGYFVARHEIEKRPLPLDKYSPLLTYLGLTLIAGSLLGFSNKITHPGLLTALPVFGTVLIIAYGRGNFLLSLKPAIWIGLISYSLYLWHQPVFAFARIWQSGSVGTIEKASLILVSISLAAVSWFLVERPFRNREKISAKSLWIFVIVATVFFCTLHGANKIYEIQRQLSPVSDISARASALSYIPDIYRDSTCRRDEKGYCLRGPENVTRWIMLGDSHLDRVAPLLWKHLKDSDVEVAFLETGGCGYAVGMEVLLNGHLDACTKTINDRRRDFILKSPPSTIVIMARYPLYIEGTWFDNGEGGVEDTGSMLMRPAEKSLSDDHMRKKAVKQAITSSLQELANAGHRLVIVYPVPEMGWDVPAKTNTETKRLNKEAQISWLSKQHFSTSHELFKTRTKNAYQALDAITGSRIIRIYPENLFCKAGRCNAHSDQFLFYGDDDHLSQDGAELVVKEILSKAAP